MKQLNRSFKVIVCLLVILASIGLGTFAQAEAPVNTSLPAPINEIFPDGPLAQVIATKLGKSTTDAVTAADLNAITSISSAEGNSKGITNLEGIQNLHNISTLNLSSNNISDIQPLSGLINLGQLILVGNHISDARPLAPLTNIYSARFDSQTITLPTRVKTAPLTLDLTGVITGYTGGIPSINSISNGGIYSTPNITWGSLTNQTAVTFRFQQTVGSTTGLFQGTVTQPLTDPDDVPIGAIDAVFPDAALAQVIATKLGKNVTDTVSQNELNTITTLTAMNQGISSLVGMHYLKAVGDLNLTGNNIADVTPLSGLTQLYKLYLVDNHISDISPLAGLTGLSIFRFDSQKFTLPTMDTIDPLSVAMMDITGMDGSKLSPDTISNGGVFISPNITWTGLTTQTKVTYTFSQHIVIGDNSGDFHGTITVPLIPDTTPPVIAADTNHTYNQGETVSPSQFLTDIEATTDDGSAVTSDFATVVDLNVAGDYTVTLQSADTAGNEAVPVTVIVQVVDTIAPIITANSPITYDAEQNINEATFFHDISAKTDDGSLITSDFDTAVNFKIPGTYTVLLQASDASGNAAAPVPVVVNIVSSAVPVISANSEVTYKQYSDISASQFLVDDHAVATNDGVVSSDFAKVVNLDAVGDYTVTLGAVNSLGNSALPVQVIVHVTAADIEPAISPTKSHAKSGANSIQTQVAKQSLAKEQRLPATGDASQHSLIFGWIILASGILLLRKN
ncbi:LapB repeat-containing protein [Listeria rustica]|uniref:LapB repeat-containing protein n=1 Tax=Listeria rustica TaxID=2713503 RepID=A0A7W1YHM3_9LIST|nr:LapB repeat-containing protein [Listeria rustica]MBA3927841.1 LapB repeat-containing protein [Listeria rustica]